MEFGDQCMFTDYGIDLVGLKRCESGQSEYIIES